MSTTTTRNSLVKPAYSDAADIAIINTNMDTIDASFAKCNWAGTATPDANEDGTKGYSTGSVWFDTTNHKLYIAETVGTGSATWRQIAESGGAYSTAYQITSTLADGTAPFVLTSKTVTTNLNADMLDGLHDTAFLKADGSVNATKTITSTLADGTKPFDVTSKTVCTNLNADMLDGLHDTSFVKQTLADAKGDLIVASAADTWARQAVSATDGDCLVADASATNGVSWQPIYGDYLANVLYNPEFNINQTGISTYTSATTPANSDDTYLLDQWTLLSDGNDIMDVWRSTSAYPTGAGMRSSILLQTETANKKAGIIQFLPALDCRGLIGGTVSLSFYAETTAANPNTHIMAGVLSWSSTGDAVTSDVVSSWEAAGTAPTLIAGWTYENVPAQLDLAQDSWTRYKIENISIDTASTANIAVFIWLDDTDSTVDDRLYITGVQLNVGPTCLPYTAPSYPQQLADCKRFFMIWNADAGAYGHLGTGAANDTEYVYVEWPHTSAWFKTNATVTMTGGWTTAAGAFEAAAGECLTPTIVVRMQDTGKAQTAQHAYVVYANNDTAARISITSRM